MPSTGKMMEKKWVRILKQSRLQPLLYHLQFPPSDLDLIPQTLISGLASSRRNSLLCQRRHIHFSCQNKLGLRNSYFVHLCISTGWSFNSISDSEVQKLFH